MASLKIWRLSRDWCPAYGDLQLGESTEELVSKIPESNRNGFKLRRVQSQISWSVDGAGRICDDSEGFAGAFCLVANQSESLQTPRCERLAVPCFLCVN